MSGVEALPEMSISVFSGTQKSSCLTVRWQNFGTENCKECVSINKNLCRQYRLGGGCKYFPLLVGSELRPQHL